MSGNELAEKCMKGRKSNKGRRTEPCSGLVIDGYGYL